MTADPPRQTEGREDNAAVPEAPGTSEVRPSDYPATRADDGVERDEPRSFDPPPNPRPRPGAGDGAAPSSPNEARTGPAGDPAEGKR